MPPKQREELYRQCSAKKPFDLSGDACFTSHNMAHRLIPAVRRNGSMSTIVPSRLATKSGQSKSTYSLGNDRKATEDDDDDFQETRTMRIKQHKMETYRDFSHHKRTTPRPSRPVVENHKAMDRLQRMSASKPKSNTVALSRSESSGHSSIISQTYCNHSQQDKQERKSNNYSEEHICSGPSCFPEESDEEDEVILTSCKPSIRSPSRNHGVTAISKSWAMPNDDPEEPLFVQNVSGAHTDKTTGKTSRNSKDTLRWPARSIHPDMEISEYPRQKRPLSISEQNDLDKGEMANSLPISHKSKQKQNDVWHNSEADLSDDDFRDVKKFKRNERRADASRGRPSIRSSADNLDFPERLLLNIRSGLPILKRLCRNHTRVVISKYWSYNAETERDASSHHEYSQDRPNSRSSISDADRDTHVMQPRRSKIVTSLSRKRKGNMSSTSIDSQKSQASDILDNEEIHANKSQTLLIPPRVGRSTCELNRADEANRVIAGTSGNIDYKDDVEHEKLLLPVKYQNADSTRRSKLDKDMLDEKRKEIEMLGSLVDNGEDTLLPLSTDETEEQCPFCNERFKKPLPEVVQKALDDIREKDKIFEKERERHLSANHSSIMARITRQKRNASNMEQYSFCRLHRIELLVKPAGREKNYPEQIDFEKIGSRIEKFKGQLLDVISGKTPSIYRDVALKAYEDLGRNRARSTMGVMARFETTLPGYYGSKGAAVIFDCLSSMFLHTGILTPEKISPQLPLEYIQQILVPEAGFRLIRDDMIKNAKKTSCFSPLHDWSTEARKVMKESSEFGSLIHPDEDEEDHEQLADTEVHMISSEESDDEEQKIYDMASRETLEDIAKKAPTPIIIDEED
ncbi:hypothetical protein EC973_004102 [Apophysomyces ossiformis]|uniref:Restriction of telomere capping protein 4 n=1 Tax=Apophysomyces ossiformis TaxID=679940 RepID=A0A8H7BQH9_9FUNG|nr:hypothetical protein EC973_004102 [Apophysomyces ossiformis]